MYGLKELRSAEEVREHAREMAARRRRLFSVVKTEPRQSSVGKLVVPSFRSSAAWSRDAAEPFGGGVTIRDIKFTVAHVFNVSVHELASERRSKQIITPRHLAMAIAARVTPKSLPQIGQSFGGRDHTTVLHACDKIRKDLKKDQKSKSLVDKLIQEIKK